MFDPGVLYITPAAQSALHQLDIDPLTLFSRHMQGDWGEVSEVDALANALAVEDGDCIVSSYLLHDQRGVAFTATVVWIISASSDIAQTMQRPYSTMVLPGEA